MLMRNAGTLEQPALTNETTTIQFKGEAIYLKKTRVGWMWVGAYLGAFSFEALHVVHSSDNTTRVAEPLCTACRGSLVWFCRVITRVRRSYVAHPPKIPPISTAESTIRVTCGEKQLFNP